MVGKLSRRRFLKAAAGLALAAANSPALEGISPPALAAEPKAEVDLAVAKSASPETAVLAAIEAVGGIGNFVKSGDVVVVKPNMGFPNPPGWGTTTNPKVVSTIVKLCIDAGARAVLVVDHPLARPEQCLKRTGIATACEELGSKKVRVSAETDQRDYKEVRLEEGKALKKTDVYKALLRADALINVPVAKSHSATGVSLGMKNIMGLIWDRRYLHQEVDLNQGIADLSTFIKPSLILLDATTVLTTGGPEGPGRTEALNTVVAGTDPVAVDSYAVTLSRWNSRRLAPKDVKHVAAASEMQLGEMNLDRLSIREVEV